MAKTLSDFEDCGVLANVPPDELERYCRSATIQAREATAVIYRQGDLCPDLFCVLSGQVKLSRVNSDGKEFTIGLMTAGDLFGPSLGHSKIVEAEATATSKGPVHVWRTQSADFRNLMFADRVLSWSVVEMLARRQRHLESRLESFSGKPTEARLAATFRELSGGFEKRCEHGFGSHIRLSQQELADLVGATRPVVSTILNRLKKQGVLGYNREYICVRQIETIERLIKY